VLLIKGLSVELLLQGRGEMVNMTAVTAVLLHYNAIDTGAECSVVGTG